MIVISANIKVSSQISTSRSMAKVSSIPSRFLYLPFQMLSNSVTGSIYCSAVIARYKNNKPEIILESQVRVLEARVIFE